MMEAKGHKRPPPKRRHLPFRHLDLNFSKIFHDGGFIQKLLQRRWVRFTFVGGAATGTYYALGLLFVPVMAMPLLIGNALAYALSFIVSYLGQCLWTFEYGHNHLAALPKFAATQAIGLGINTCVVELCARMGFIYAISMVVASVVSPIFVFFICKYWVFKRKEADSPQTPK